MRGFLVLLVLLGSIIAYLWYAGRRGPVISRRNMAVVGALVVLAFIGNIVVDVAYFRFRMGQGVGYTTGHITEVRRKQRLLWYVFTYRVQGRAYEGRHGGDAQPLFPGCDETRACIGQPVQVRYAINDPAVNELPLPQ